MDISLELLGGVLAAIASIAGIGSFLMSLKKSRAKVATDPPQPSNSASQSTFGPNSPNIAHVQGNVILTINAGKSKLDIPTFDFSLQRFPGWRRDPELGAKFNKAIFEFLGETVYLSITLSEDMTNTVSRDRDEYGRITFTVKNNSDDSSFGGAEYLVHLSKNDRSPFEIRDNVALLSGYFKIYDINGPRQGYISVNLRPVKVD